MLQKGFIRKQTTQNSTNYKVVTIASKVMLYLGAFILIGTFGYLLVHWGKTDYLAGMLMPLIVAGLGLVFVSRLILRAYKKLGR
jgi:hypothetical protein